MSWNRPEQAALYAAKPVTTSRSNLLQSATKAAGSGVLFFAAKSNFWELSRHFPDFVRPLTGVAGYIVAALLLLSCLQQILGLTSLQKQPISEKLTNKQRTLFGLPLPAQTPQRDPHPVRATPTKQPMFPIGPPARHVKPFTPPPHAAETSEAGRSPLTPWSVSSSQRQASPFQSTPTVTTPEQLQQYLDAFDEQAHAGSPSGHAAQGEPSPAVSMYAAGAAFMPPFGASEQPVQHYRPSLQGRGNTGTPLRADVLLPSSPETLAAVLRRLRTDARTAEVWIDRFREWLAAEVVKPAVRLMAVANQDVARTARALGWTVELSSLAQPDAAGSDKGLEADEEAQLRMLREALSAQLRGPLQEAQRKAVLACLQAVNQYQRLTVLLRGESPRSLLPPVPRGYVASRLRELAQGSCLAAFTWDAGGSWQAKPWTPDLVTDTALVFYLFAAFLEAPKWLFALDDAPPAAAGPPLYIGSLPSRPAQHCTALLPVRPPALPRGATAVLALGLGTRKPTLTLVLGGEPVLTLTGYTAAFLQLLLLVQSCKLDNFGAVGNNSLEYLRLAAVVRPADALYDLFRGKWFGLW